MGLVLSIGAAAPAAATAPAASRSIGSVKSTPGVPNGAWTTYHRDDGHTGHDPTLSSTATGAGAGWVSGTMDDTVHAEPLVYNGVVYAATLGNTVYAFDQSTGATLWSKNVGAPQTTGWSCGNISPTGILGTPVIDTVANRLYAVAEDAGSTPTYYLFGLDLGNKGAIVLQTVVTTPAAGFDWTIEQERGALGLHNGFVYVPFGGRAGDCGSYHGYVFAVPTNGNAVTNFYQTPGQGAGFWAAGGVVIDDSTGKVFDSSGNGTASGCNNNLDGTPTYENDAVVRLSSTLAHEDAFIPLDWQRNWCSNDQDLGSASMVLISSTLAFQAGKWGNGFLVNPEALGGMDGQLYPTPKPAGYVPVDVCLGNHSDANFGSYAYAAPYVYLSCEGNGLVALSINTSTPSFSSCDASCTSPSWHAGGFSPGPPIVAGGAVWAVDQGGGGLYGFDATTGAQIYHSAAFSVHHFTTPSEAGGQIFVGSSNVIRSFDISSTTCSQPSLSGAPPSPSATGTSVVFTAATSVCPNPRYRFWVGRSGNWTIAQDYSAASTFTWNATGLAGVYGIEVDVRDATSSAPYDAVRNITYTLSACTGAGIGASPSSPQLPGATITVTGSATCPGTPTYRFWVGQGGGWSIVQDYSTASTFSWNTTGKPFGTYGLEVDVRDQGATASYEKVANVSYFLGSAPCSTPTLGASPLSPGPTGASVLFTASTSGCANPTYRFWVGQGGAWTIVQDYSSASTFSWAGTGRAGSYGIEVDVRSAGSSVLYDHVANITYSLAGCTTAHLATDKTSPQAPGATVMLTGSSTCPGTPQYRFWVGKNGAWTIVQDFSATSTFSWNTTGKLEGTYGLEVDVRDQGATASYEAVANLTFVLYATPCTLANISTDHTSPQPNGTMIVVTGSATCGGTPEYRFWVRDATGHWSIAQDYSSSNTFSWNTTGLPAGTYGLEVDVRNQGSTAVYETVANATFGIT